MKGAPRPTVVQVKAPWCGECRAMESDLDAVAADYAASVDLITVDVAADPNAAEDWRVKGTPTLIGLAAGREIFRHTGRLSRAELEDLFSALSAGEAITPRSIADLVVRLGAGVVLMILGLTTGPTWALVAVGGIVLGFGVAPLLKWGR